MRTVCMYENYKIGGAVSTLFYSIYIILHFIIYYSKITLESANSINIFSFNHVISFTSYKYLFHYSRDVRTRNIMQNILIQNTVEVFSTDSKWRWVVHFQKLFNI